MPWERVFFSCFFFCGRGPRHLLHSDSRQEARAREWNLWILWKSLHTVFTSNSLGCAESRMTRALLFFALCVCAAGVGLPDNATGQQGASAANDAGNALFDWVRAHGGEVLPCHKPVDSDDDLLLPLLILLAVALCSRQLACARCCRISTALTVQASAPHQAHLRVATVRDALRGTVAAKDIAAGEMVLAVPASLGIPLGEYGEYSSAVRARST